MADQGCVWLLAAFQGPWALAYAAAYRLYARYVCDNSVLEMISWLHDNTQDKFTFNFSTEIDVCTNLCVSGIFDRHCL